MQNWMHNPRQAVIDAKAALLARMPDVALRMRRLDEWLADEAVQLRRARPRAFCADAVRPILLLKITKLISQTAPVWKTCQRWGNNKWACGMGKIMGSLDKFILGDDALVATVEGYA